MLTLYFAPNSCSLATHLALEYVGADYRAVRVDMSGDEQRSSDYLRLNPKGRVPVLLTERGALTETPALLQYVCQRFPEARLAPLEDPFALAQFNEFNSYLCATVHVAHAHRMRGSRWADDAGAIAAMQKKAPESVGDCFALVERGLLAGPWVLSSGYSACDMYLFTLAQWLEPDGVDVTRLPRILEHRSRMQADPVVLRTLAAETATV